jgi:hypothetical protein
LAINHPVLVAYSHSDIEVDNFQTKVRVDDKVFGLDVSMGDTELVKIRDTLDEAPADLSDLPIKSDMYERDHFWENDPRRRLYLERLVQRDNVFGLRPESI